MSCCETTGACTLVEHERLDGPGRPRARLPSRNRRRASLLVGSVTHAIVAGPHFGRRNASAGLPARRTRAPCIRIGAVDESSVMRGGEQGIETAETMAATAARRATAASEGRVELEVRAYAVAASRGDVLPVALRLAELRSRAQWLERRALIDGVGPSCERSALDRACELMPRAAEPRLLRAAAALRHAAIAPTCSVRASFLSAAHADLVAVARIDPMDATARAMLAELAGAQAWAVSAACAA